MDPCQPVVRPHCRTLLGCHPGVCAHNSNGVCAHNSNVVAARKCASSPDGVTVAREWVDVAAHFHSEQNFVLEGACSPVGAATTRTKPGGFRFPSAAAIVDALRQHPDTRISTGKPKATLDLGTDADTQLFATALRNAPLDEVLRTRFALAHFKLEAFDVPGGLLEGLREQVIVPWAAALQAAGFSFHRCYPILFITNAVEELGEVMPAETSYHMDQSHVVAWQIHGRKRWNWLRNPSALADREVRLTHIPGQLQRPQQLEEKDIVRLEMGPGQTLFNKLLTPHWVEAVAGEVAVSLNLSHGGLALDGELMHNETELMQYVHQQRLEKGAGGEQPSPPVGQKPAWEGLPGQHRARF